MHAYLITGYSKDLISQKIDELVSNLKVKRLGFEMKKIADVKELAKFTNLSLNEKSAIVIENIDKATTEAQNAFLKNLEEPQENLIYILTAKSQDSVLPTIASRCQVVEVVGQNLELSSEGKKGVNEFLKSKIGEKILYSSKITKREDAIQFIKDIILVLHDPFKEEPNLLHSIELATLTLRNLESNGNIQIQLTNFIVNSQ